MSYTQQECLDIALHPVESAEPVIERVLFNNRIFVISLFLLTTIYLAVQAIELKPDASFEKMIPVNHPYIANYLENKEDLSGMGNVVRIALETTEGTIFDAEFLNTLQKAHDEVFFIPGVDRSGIKSIWSSGVRWNEVTEQGFDGGPVIPDTYDGSEAQIQQLKANVLKSGQIGTLVANNFKSAMIIAPLLDKDPNSGERIDYHWFSSQLESLVRDKYQSDKVKVHITGFVKVVGDLIDGASQVAVFFAIALVITLVMLYLYSRCLRSTLVALLCSITAVIWQMGLLSTLGYGLDPYSMLVPFLVFAIAVSHGVQIINGIAHEAQRHQDKMQAARKTFRLLYIPGLTALVSDGIGFATLMVIEIEVIQDLAKVAGIGVAVIIMTNLVLLPILMSFIGVSRQGVELVERQEQGDHRFAHLLSNFTQKKQARIIILIAAGLFGYGWYASQGLKVGDLDAGAPELRPDSRYNLDNAFMSSNYATSSDIFVVMVKSAADGCGLHSTQHAIDQLQWQLTQLPGVQSVNSLVNSSKIAIMGMNEGNPKWYSLLRNDGMTNAAAGKLTHLFNSDCSLVPVLVYLDDHRAETLTRVVDAVDAFAQEHNTEEVQFVMAAGNAGIEAATNIVIETSQYKMLIWVYGVVAALCLLTFRSLRTVICILVPLALTSLLCQALMTHLGIGVKVATLPVIALGVGIGVDYGIYIYSKLETYLKQGQSLQQAYFKTLKTTGKAVAFTGITLGIGVATWVFSPIKFQADMGILLTFMFLWNMVGALTLLPALAAYLLKVESNDMASSELEKKKDSVVAGMAA